jgi:predicted transcriptional regulator
VESRRRLRPDVNVTLELREFPLDIRCNPLASARTATLACDAAAILEAVADVRGRKHTLAAAQALMARPNRSRFQMAQDVKINAGWVDANYGRLLERVQTDVDLGLSNGVLMTPTVAVNGVQLRSPSPEVLAAVLDHELREVSRSATAPGK